MSAFVRRASICYFNQFKQTVIARWVSFTNPRYIIYSTQSYSSKSLSKVDGFDGKHTKCPVRFASGLICMAAFNFIKSNDEEKKDTKQNEQTDPKGEVIILIKRGKLSEQRQEVVEAEKYYHQALSLVAVYEKSKKWPKEDLIQAKTYIYDCMANLAMARGQFEKAEILFKETMKGLLQQGIAQNDNAVIEISLKLAMIYVMLQRHNEAEQGYEYCIKTQEAKFNNDNLSDSDEDSVALLGLAVDSYSRFLLVQSKLPPALENFQKALTIAVSVFGKYHPQVAVLHNDIATVNCLLKDYDLAKENVAQAIHIAKYIDSQDLASFLCNLGAISIHQKEFTLAEESCVKALKLAAKDKNKSAKQQAESCLNELKKQRNQEQKK